MADEQQNDVEIEPTKKLNDLESTKKSDDLESTKKSDDLAPSKKFDDFDHFEATDAGASKTYPMQCSALRKGGAVVIKGRPCKIVELSTSKTGKHGHAKVHLVAIDYFTNKKIEDLCPSTHNMEVPVLDKEEFQLLDVSDDDFLNLVGQNGTKDDVRLPEGELGERIRWLAAEQKEATITILTAMGEQAVIEVRDLSKGD